MNNQITNIKISYTQKISQSDKSVLIQIDDNKAVWINKKFINPQLRRLTPDEQKQGIKLNPNNQDHILKGIYSLGINQDYMYDVMTSTKDEFGKFNKTQETWNGKVLALQAEKYSKQLYQNYLKEKKKTKENSTTSEFKKVYQQSLKL